MNLNEWFVHPFSTCHFHDALEMTCLTGVTKCDKCALVYKHVSDCPSVSFLEFHLLSLSPLTSACFRTASFWFSKDQAPLSKSIAAASWMFWFVQLKHASVTVSFGDYTKTTQFFSSEIPTLKHCQRTYLNPDFLNYFRWKNLPFLGSLLFTRARSHMESCATGGPFALRTIGTSLQKLSQKRHLASKSKGHSKGKTEKRKKRKGSLSSEESICFFENNADIQ